MKVLIDRESLRFAGEIVSWAHKLMELSDSGASDEDVIAEVRFGADYFTDPSHPSQLELPIIPQEPKDG